MPCPAGRGFRQVTRAPGRAWLPHVLLAILLTRSACDIPFARVGLGPFTLGVVENLLVAAAGLLAWLRLSYRWRRYSALTFGPFALWQLIACTYAPDVAGALRIWAAQVTYPAMFVLAAHVAVAWRSLARVNLVLIASLVPPLLAAAAQAALAPGSRVYATFMHPNILALFLVYLAPLVLWRLRTAWQRGDRVRVALLATLFAAMSVAELLTQTRSAWSGFAIVIVLFAVMLEKRLLVFLPVIAAATLVIPAVQERLSAAQDFEGYTVEQVAAGDVVVDSYSWRKLLWQAAWRDAEGHRLIGQGVGSFEYNTQRFFRAASAEVDPHSIFVQLTYEQGYVGMTLFAWQLIGLLLLGVRAWRVSAAAAYVTVSLVATTLLVGYSDNVYFYLAANWYAYALWAICPIAALEGARVRERAFPALRRRAATIGRPSYPLGTVVRA